MNRTIPIFLFFILLSLSSVQLAFAGEQISIGFDPDQVQPPIVPPSLPSNVRPYANITGPRIGYVNQSLIFSAQYSHDPDGIIIGYRWDFENDGLFDTEWTKEILVIHSYPLPGNYTIKLQVKDNDQQTGVSFFTITILQLPPPLRLPVAQANGPYQGYASQAITFSSKDSYDPDGIIVNYSWDFGDKTRSYEQNPVHIYVQPGDYIVTLTIRDNDNLSNIALASVYIRESNKSGAPSTSLSSPPLIPMVIGLSFFLIIVIVVIFVWMINKLKDEWEKIYFRLNNELRKNMNNASDFDKMVQGNLHVLEKQHAFIEETLKELQVRKIENRIDQEEYRKIAVLYHQMLERINQNIKKYQDLAERSNHTSSGKLGPGQ